MKKRERGRERERLARDRRKRLHDSYLAKVIKCTRVARAAKSIRDNLYTSTPVRIQKYVLDYVSAILQGGLSVHTRKFSVLETREPRERFRLHNDRNSTLRYLLR